MGRKKIRSEPNQSQLTLDKFDKYALLQSLTEKQLKIIQLLNEGYYQAAIARKLNLDKSFICRFVKKLRDAEFITVEWINPLTHRATSYRLSKELQNFLPRIDAGVKKTAFTLCLPHKIRYRRKIMSMSKPMVTDIGRFAAAKFKHVRSWNPHKGDERHLFEMQHERVGKVGIIVHPNSVEYYQAYRHHIIAESIEDATSQLSMALEESTARFAQELGWCGVDIEYGNPKLVTSPHYAFPSRYARKLTDRNQTQLQFAEGMEIDKSLEAKLGEKRFAEIETPDEEIADIVDRGLRNAANINNIIPELVKPLIHSEIAAAISPLHTNFQNLIAHIQAGTTNEYKMNQLLGLLSQTLKTMHELQDEVKKLKEKKS